MTSSVSKKAFIVGLTSRIIATPFLAAAIFLLLSVFLIPFLPNHIFGLDIRIVIGLLSFLCTISIILIPYILRTGIDKGKDVEKIGQVARIISQFDLNLEEAELINRVEGWDYKKIVGDRLTEEQLQKACVLASSNQLKNESYEKGRMLLGIIVSFSMSIIFFAGFQVWKSGDYKPIILGLLFLGLGLFLLNSYRLHQQRIEVIKEKIERLKPKMANAADALR